MGTAPLDGLSTVELSKTHNTAATHNRQFPTVVYFQNGHFSLEEGQGNPIDPHRAKELIEETYSYKAEQKFPTVYQALGLNGQS
jgi:hypothetical protein